MLVDYRPSKQCKNSDTYGMICVKCGECGRKFEDGKMIEYVKPDKLAEYFRKEQSPCDDCREDGASLMYYIRFGQNAGEHHIPYSQIRRWKVE